MDKSKAAAFAAVVVAANVGHDVGDFITQNDAMACNKAAPGYNPPGHEPTDRESWAANQRHCLSYHAALGATVALVCAATGVRLRPHRAAAGLAFSYATHALIDRRWPVHRLMVRTGSEGFYSNGGAPLVDQALHKACVFVGSLIAVS